MRFAMTVSNILSLSKSEGYKPLNYKDVFFMSTLGGAHGMLILKTYFLYFSSLYENLFLALGIGDKVGNFEVGKNFDALIVNLAQADGNIELWQNESIENRFSKWIHLGDDRTISQVYVQGVEVKEKAKGILRIKRQNSKRKSSDFA